MTHAGNALADSLSFEPKVTQDVSRYAVFIVEKAQQQVLRSYVATVEILRLADRGLDGFSTFWGLGQ